MGGEGEKLSLEQASFIACEVISELDPACERIEVAGSVRRKRPEVGDLEIVCIPKTRLAGQLPLFGLAEGKRVSVLKSHLEVLIKEGKLQEHPTDSKMGKRYMKVQHPCGISVDIFAVLPPAHWGVIYLLRTGSKEFNFWVLEQARKGGITFEEGQLLSGGEVIPAPEEKSVFEALGLPFVRPTDRDDGRWLNR